MFKFRLILLLLISQLIIFAYESGKAEAGLNKVNLQLKWTHQFQFAGYYAAIEKGYYKEVGLDVNLIEGRENVETPKYVLKGDIEFGVGTADIILYSDSVERPVILATIFQHSPLAIATLKSSGIENVQNLISKRLMIEAHAADLLTFMADEGVPISKCTTLTHSTNIFDLINNKVDAFTVYQTDELYVLKNLNLDYNLITPVSGGIDFYGDLLYTSQRLMESNPELVAKFRAASIKGWQYALQHKKELVDLIYDKYSTNHSKEHLMYEAIQMEKYILPDVVEIGYSNIGRWKNIAEIFHKLKFSKEAANLDGLFYNDYIEKEIHIPWLLITIVLSILSLLIVLVYFFYNLSQSLKRNEEKLKELNSTKDVFFSIIAHDLRNPLGGARSVSKMLNESFDTFSKEELQDFIRMLSESVENVFELLENLLIWAKSQQGKINFNPELLNVDSIIANNIRLSTLSADNKNITISKDYTGEINLFADANLLNSIVRNLLNNAIKFTKNGGQIHIKVMELDDSFQISIIDNGIGMNEETIKKLFRIDTHHTTLGTNDEKGTGLGLILCKEFVEKHNGKIWVESSLGVGSTFTFSLPKKIN